MNRETLPRRRKPRTCWTDWFKPTEHRYRYDHAMRFWEACSQRRLKEVDRRRCTCHPSDNPPVPCARKFAYSECVAAR